MLSKPQKAILGSNPNIFGIIFAIDRLSVQIFITRGPRVAKCAQFCHTSLALYEALS